MRILIATLATLFFCEFSLAHSGAQEGKLLLRLKYESHDQIKNLVNADLDIAGIDLKNSTVDILINTHDRNGETRKILESFNIVNEIDIDVTMAPDSRYQNHAEITQFVTDIHNRFPNITSLKNIGNSLQGREIWALKISDNPESHETSEPAILYNSMHHAREIMTPEVALDIINYLTSHYQQDPKVTDWINENEIWVVPMVNPDGNHRVWNQNSMWRKNVRNDYGVDLNRNYPYKWGSCNGSSGSTNSDTYRGPSPGSEPETQALMALVAQIQPVFDISFHSYSELVIYPQGCQGERSVNTALVEGVGREMASLVESDNSRDTYTPGTAWELLYSVDGGDIDWMHAEHHVIPYVIEVNSSWNGFQPSYDIRDETVEKLRPAWQLLLDRVKSSGVRGMVRDGSGRTISGANIKIQNLGNKFFNDFNMKVKNDGTYHIVLEPGMYKIQMTHEGRTKELEIIVGNNLVLQDIVL